MKEFRAIATDLRGVKSELNDFDALLSAKAELSERADLQPFFKGREQLSAFLGTFTDAGPSTHLAYEFPFLGDFAADLVVGNRGEGKNLVVELEDGTPSSVFAKIRGKKTKEYSRRFDHGYSQLIDWFACLDDYRQTAKFKDEFGPGAVTFRGLLVVGRSAGMTLEERRRLAWRSSQVVVNSQAIACITFDDLCRALRRQLDLYLQSGRGAKKS